MPERFSSLKELHEKLWNKAQGNDEKKRIYFISEDMPTSIVVDDLLPIARQTSKDLLFMEDDHEDVYYLLWTDITSAHTKVKATDNDDEDWWEYYDDSAKGGRKKTRRKKGGKKRKTRKRTGGGLFKGKSTISTNFESGNINHIKNVQRKKDVLVVLEIENEPYPKNTKRKYQNWFYFKSNDVQRKSMT